MVEAEEAGEEGPWIGIDLGTCCSVVGLWQNNQVTILQAMDTNDTYTPSVVGFRQDDSSIVGSNAVNLSVKDPKNTLYDSKRLIGRRFDDIDVQADIDLWPFTVVEGEDGRPKMAYTVNDEQKLLYPEQVSAKVLEKLKLCAEQKCLRKVKNVVVTVPAYFNDIQKQATKDACQIAGLECKRILNEPTAAAIAYGFDKAGDAEKLCLVFDFGGGTLDISILSIFRRKIEVKVVNGDTHLGGEDIDNILMNHCIDHIKNKYGVDLINDQRAKARIRKCCKEAKHALTDADQIDLVIDSISENVDFDYNLSLAEFNELCAPVFEKCMPPLVQALEDSDINKSDIDEIILVGGSTRIPKIQEMLTAFFDGQKLNRQLNPDEAVAYGATVQAGILSGSQEVADIEFKDVIPISIGVEVLGSSPWDLQDTRMSKIILKNSTYPCSETKNYYDPGMGTVEMRVIQGEAIMAKDCHTVTETLLKNIPPGGQVDVTYTIDDNGILKVTARPVDAEDRTVSLTISQAKLNLPEDELARLIEIGEQQRVQAQEKLDQQEKDYNKQRESAAAGQQ